MGPSRSVLSGVLVFVRMKSAHPLPIPVTVCFELNHIGDIQESVK